MTLEKFLAAAGALTKAEQEQIVDQALVLIGQCYVHLPLKRAMHALDSVQRLRLARQRLAGMSERQFHDEMISIFTELRDLHTNYILPAPYRSKTAFLPFLLEEYFEDKTRKYLVTKMLAGFSHPQFNVGVTITHWNGIPFERAVELNADRQAGSNPDARRARGLEAMTVRPMALSSPPDEQWVVLSFVDTTGQPRETKIDWKVFEPDPSPAGANPFSGRDPAATRLGIDALTEAVRRAKKHLFNEKAMSLEHQAHAIGGRQRDSLNLAEGSLMPDVLSFRTVNTLSGIFGYVRIWTFNVDDPEAFIREFIRIASLLPQNGLIIDVRGNGGGHIMAAEGLLQVLTPNRIQPTFLSLINTPLTLELCRHSSFLSQWMSSIQASLETGEVYSQGFPIAPLEDYNRVGQRYQGPVILITDALCYSATDIFSAGFQDNQIGLILGAHGNTGAGGANVWTHELLHELLPGPDSPFKILPKEASFRVAVRRVIRAGRNTGVPLEDLGVVPNERHFMTKNDLLNSNQDLIAKAATLLAQQPLFSLEATVGVARNGIRKVEAITKSIDRMDAFVDSRPRLSVDVRDGTNKSDLPTGQAAHHLELRGLKDGVLKVVKHIDF